MAYDPRLVSSTSTSAGTASTTTTTTSAPPPPHHPRSTNPNPNHNNKNKNRSTKNQCAPPRAQRPTQPSQPTMPLRPPQHHHHHQRPHPALPSTADADSYKLRFCTVCASNQNRSMEAHLRLSTATPSPFPVISFGTGSLVRLPGPTVTQPNIYHFNTTSYSQMYEELTAKDERLYRYNGLLNMLDRNRNLKWGPERFQDWVPGLPRVDHVAKGDKGALGTEGGVVDVIITCEERCWDAVVDDLMAKGAPLNRPVHVFNVDIKDNHEEALVGGKAILELAHRLNEAARQERRAAGAEAGGRRAPPGTGRTGRARRGGISMSASPRSWPPGRRSGRICRLCGPWPGCRSGNKSG